MTLQARLEQARHQHKAGQVKEACRVYRELVASNDLLHEAWHLLGIAALQSGDPAESARCLARAIEACPDKPAYYSNLGLAYRDLKEPAQAIHCFEKALALDPQHLPSLQNIGVLHIEAGRLAEGRRFLQQAKRLSPHDPQVLLQLGRTYLQQGDPAKAKQVLEQALSKKADWTDALLELGNALLELKQIEEALRAFSRAYELKREWRAACRLAQAHLELKDYQAAEKAAADALHDNPSCVQALSVLGVVQHESGQLAESVATLQRAIRAQPDFLPAHVNLGVTLLSQGRSAEALASFEAALLIDPKAADAHCNRALLLLRRGRMQEGWAEYEWRWHKTAKRRRIIPRPRWDGSPLDGRTLLIHGEQGLGDTLQFLRYCQLVERNNGSRIMLAVQPPLMELLKTYPHVDQLVRTHERSLPPFDVHIPLLSLPAYFTPSMESIPNQIPYLTCRNDLKAKWADYLEPHSGLKIGIAWQGSKKYGGDRYRSVPLQAFEPLFGVKGVTFLSLQKGVGTEQLAEVEFRAAVVELPEDRDTTEGAFVDSAAILSNLDLLITSDTSIAHLAGALGVPVWMATSFAADWRWLEGREDSPWYPSLRLFRQERLFEWRPVFERMAGELAKVVEGDRQRLLPAPNRSSPCPAVPVSLGELIDKLTILTIKEERIADEGKRRNICRERGLLQEALRQLAPSAGWQSLADQLKTVNESLWEIEDNIRRCEARQDFGEEFIRLARSVYRENDRRAALKRAINDLLGSALIEEKSYAAH
jgi:tetratricopeptide (TPR) repeat protein